MIKVYACGMTFMNIYIFCMYMLAIIAGQTAGPNWWTFLGGTHGYTLGEIFYRITRRIAMGSLKKNIPPIRSNLLAIYANI